MDGGMRRGGLFRGAPHLKLLPSAPRWEFIKENKKVRKQEKTLSTKKAIKKPRKKKERKHALDQESDQEKKTIMVKKKRKKTLSTKKATKKKRKTLFLLKILTSLANF